MSLNGPLKQILKYKDGRTKQSFKDETDINKIMARASKAGTMTHLQKFEGVYADYSDVDFFGMTQQLTKGREIFDELPAELRQEFGQSPAKFFAYVNDPANKDNLQRLLPALSAPGRQLNPTVAGTADELAAVAAVSPPAGENPQPNRTVAPSTPGPSTAPPEPMPPSGA